MCARSCHIGVQYSCGTLIHLRASLTYFWSVMSELPINQRAQIRVGHLEGIHLDYITQSFIIAYKARFIANSSSCTTTELSKLLTSCLTAVKKHVIKYCEKVYERSGKNLFWSIKNSGEILDKLKARDFNATSLSTYDFSTLYTTLPHNLIKDKLIDLIERTFQREGSPYLACSDRNAFFTSEKPKKYHAWSCQNVCDALTFFCWTTFLFDLAPSSIDK